MRINRKKGQADFSIYIAMSFAFAAIIVILVMVLVNVYKDRSVETTQLEGGIYIEKIYYSPQILLLEEKGIFEFGVLDLNKLMSENLNSSNTYEKPHLGAQLRVVDYEGVQLAIAYNNEEVYKKYAPLAENVLLGSGSAKRMQTMYPVRISDGSGAMLEITVVVPYE